ncbi:postacrosomal sheath WW domain-binding protein [Cynocephalus volans]|uniref:postacrosomal sheath WW domain-binding protein n=1 Tax=Cynocephalus volans TaxID=110931 RepID=UPI002FC83ED2
MAVNQSHTEDRRGASIPYGESLLKQCSDVELSFPQQPEGSNLFCGTKRGTLFLTSYRVIFVTSRSVNDPMLSFMMPFDLMDNCSVEQPVFAANYIKGIIRAAPDGGWEGQATFKLIFRKGGAIEFAQLMMRAASSAARGVPLRTLNYWFGPAGIYVITGEGNMCTPQMPCPVIVYGSPPVAYGALPAGYGAQPPGYGTLPPGYGAPPPGYGAPPPGYAAPPAGYGAPPPEYGALPPGHGTPPPGYQAPSTGYGALPARNELPAAGSGVEPHSTVAAQTPEYDASLPSASSTQAHSPPSKM